MKSAISVRDLGKCYTTGENLRYNALRDVLAEKGQQLLRSLQGKPQPTQEASNTFWALRDISFDVAPGEVLGVIGHNGAGKSTLLKILTRITAPTKGEAFIHGRVGSLLEVGTGFHPELTGRENIYLNGTILGLSRAEITQRFDDIVGFADVAAFIDTPVKRYSSGMQMRLAFAVAAHLDPEILLIDEVLTVGDAKFRQKSLQKMGEVASQGRTILFVSHNMAAIMNLCQRSILLDGGRLVAYGKTSEIIQQYLSNALPTSNQKLAMRTDRQGTGVVRITDITWHTLEGELVQAVQSGAGMIMRLAYTTRDHTPVKDARLSIAIDGVWGQRLCMLDTDYTSSTLLTLSPEGVIECRIPSLHLAAGLYNIAVCLTVNGVVSDWVQGAATLSVEAADFYGQGRFPDPQDGPVLLPHQWQVNTTSPVRMKVQRG